MARAALETLCQAYWPPIYAFVRRQGHAPHDAQDLTQEFFARLLATDALTGVDRSKGRFRSFLLASLKHFLANEWDKARAQKRGGGHIPLPINASGAESTLAVEPIDTMSADRLFDRRWAVALLGQVMTRLRAEYVANGKEEIFDQLKETLAGERASLPYAEMARRMGTSEGAVKVAAHRLRGRYRELLRAEVAQTIANPGEVEEELRHLFAALRG